MELLKEKIRKEGYVTENNILMVDSFLNHQMDVTFFNEIGKEFKNRFKDEKIDKILTIEATGIGLGIITAQYFDNIPVVFGKKLDRVSRDLDAYKSEVMSFTKKTVYNVVVDKKFIKPGEKVLIIDDFLANGCAVFGLMDIVRQSGAEIVGVGIVIEKGFQNGRKYLEEKGVRVESLVIVDKVEGGEVSFR